MKLRGARAILFDIDDTLFPTTEFAQRARKSAVRAMVKAGLNAAGAQAYSTLRGIVRNKSSNYQYHLDDLCVRFNHKRDPKIIAAGIAAYHVAKAGIRPFPRVRKALLALRKRGYGIYAASEGKALKQWDKLYRLGLHNVLQGAFISEELGCDKGKAFYVKIARILHMPAASVLMVGDREGKDIIPAKEAGMKTARVCKKGAKSEADAKIADLSGLLKLLR
jgi:putative hydrolase of the HAD superfamily